MALKGFSSVQSPVAPSMASDPLVGVGVGYGSGTSSQAVNVMAAMAKAMTLYSIFFIVVCFLILNS
jgi:hypothetical protein